MRSIGPDDLLIVEGVPALTQPALCAIADVRVLVEVDDVQRLQRLHADYHWRGDPSHNVATRLRSRDLDELPIVRASAVYATHHISTS